MRKRNKLIHGVGINDADYQVVIHKFIEGKHRIVWRCPFYVRWASILERCYGKNNAIKTPSYVDCTIAEEWLVFSSFREWMSKEKWEGRFIDKDLLHKGNKVYSKDTCVFVDRTTNNFVVDRGVSTGIWPIGVTFREDVSKYRAKCRDPFNRKPIHLGYFSTPEAAHKAWKKAKHEHACKLADLQDDPRVAAALRQRYLPEYEGGSNEQI